MLSHHQSSLAVEQVSSQRELQPLRIWQGPLGRDTVGRWLNGLGGWGAGSEGGSEAPASGSACVLIGRSSSDVLSVVCRGVCIHLGLWAPCRGSQTGPALGALP